MADDLGALGEIITDRTLILNVIRGLNDRFSHVGALLRHRRPFPTSPAPAPMGGGALAATEASPPIAAASAAPAGTMVAGAVTLRVANAPLPSHSHSLAPRLAQRPHPQAPPGPPSATLGRRRSSVAGPCPATASAAAATTATAGSRCAAAPHPHRSAAAASRCPCCTT